MIILVIFSCQAYSVYDEEVGYCQGLSFLSAVLLLHVNLFSLPIGYIIIIIIIIIIIRIIIMIIIIIFFFKKKIKEEKKTFV